MTAARTPIRSTSHVPPSSIHRSALVVIATLLLGVVTRAIAQDAPPDEMTKRLAACAACHGDAGEGRAGNAYYPHLAGKPAGYLVSQLRAFRDGRRVYAQMNWLMRNMDDAYLGVIAAHYAALPPRSSAQPVAMREEDAARARELVEAGDAAHRVPACAACHGGDLAGQAPGVPALIGLPADYIVAQLGAWRSGVRRADAPDCMADVARALDPGDIRVVAQWLAEQGTAASRAPAPAGSFALPTACGAMPARRDAQDVGPVDDRRVATRDAAASVTPAVATGQAAR